MSQDTAAGGNVPSAKPGTLFGQPTGLYTLFFAEMWERFSYYGMRALLVLYMTKGFLGYGDKDAYVVYGAYTALVYMTPFIGGILADRLLGARRAVILGAILMASGQLLLAFANKFVFFAGLGLLICGNGFFKPNISNIVGSLYPHGSPKRDSGFTIFYMGINLGAAMSPLLCTYIGETYGWEWGFGMATVGMITGLAVFSNWLPPQGAGAPPDAGRLRRRPVFVTQALIAAGAVGAAVLLFIYWPDNLFSIAVNVFVGVALLAAAGVACFAIRRDAGGVISLEWAVYLGAILFIPAFLLLVSGFAPLRKDNRPVSVLPESMFKRMNAAKLAAQQLEQVDDAVDARDTAAIDQFAEDFQKLAQARQQQAKPKGDLQYLSEDQRTALRQIIDAAKAQRWSDAHAAVQAGKLRLPSEPGKAILAVVLEDASRPAGLVLLIGGLFAFGYIGVETVRLPKVARQRMYVVLTLTFFSMVFWAFYEQAGSSLNIFTDRNVNRVFPQRQVAAEEAGRTIMIEPTQAQLGCYNGDQLFTMNTLTKLRKEHQRQPDFKIPWKVTDKDVGMGVATRTREIPTGTFQSVNPIYILIFGLLFSAMWTFLASRRLEPSTPVKFAAGLVQLGLGFAVFWYGTRIADARGMVALPWLLLGYLLHTTGELCLSPVGLSMITNLSPRRLVATVMGAWFLATAFSQLMAAMIAQFTAVTHGSGDEIVVPAPIKTVHVYGQTYGVVAVAAFVAAVILFALSPLLSRWMHPEAEAGK